MPWVARAFGTLRHGYPWFAYGSAGPGGLFLIEATTAIDWLLLLAVSFLIKPPLVWLPAAFVFGYLWWVHRYIDITKDSTAALAIVFSPLVALAFLAAGTCLALAADWIAGKIAGRRTLVADERHHAFLISTAFVCVGNEIVGRYPHGQVYWATRWGVEPFLSVVLLAQTIFRSRGALNKGWRTFALVLIGTIAVLATGEPH